MRLDFPAGKCAAFSSSKEAVEYLNSFKTEYIITEPDKLFISSAGRSLILKINDGQKRAFPIRQSFLEKLLRWYSFPIRQLEYLDIDTLTAVCNDYLLNIRAKYVVIKIENDEALTITSDKFSEIKDVDLINKMKKTKIESIFIDDFSTMIRMEEKHSIIPFRGDEFGVGMMVSNSETGFGALRINDYLLRYVCSNGSYLKEKRTDLTFYHYNLFTEDVFNKIETMVAETAFRAKVIEERLRRMETPIAKEEIGIINKDIVRNTAVKMLNDLMESDTQLTRYDLFNIITDRAKEFGFSIRTKIEVIAGSMV